MGTIKSKLNHISTSTHTATSIPTSTQIFTSTPTLIPKIKPNHGDLFICDECHQTINIQDYFYSCLKCQSLDFCMTCANQNLHRQNKSYNPDNPHLKAHRMMLLDGNQKTFVNYLNNRKQLHNPRPNACYITDYFKPPIDPNTTYFRMEQPIIYVYHPTIGQSITIELINHQPQKITFTNLYPQPPNQLLPSWNLINLGYGHIFDTFTQRPFRSLFWEANNEFDSNCVIFHPNTQSVQKSDYIQYLEETLDRYGLERSIETTQMIQFWLPILNQYQQCLILFDSTYLDHIELKVTPTPDQITRVFMWIIENPQSSLPLWTPKPQLETETIYQQLQLQRQNKFVIIEWGGCHLKN